MTDHFDRFWAIYPRKIAKGAALKAWDKMMKGMDDSEREAHTNRLLLAIEAQKRYFKHAQSLGEFVPPWKHPATWLNGMCWEDEIKSHAELAAKHETRTCKDCDKPVHGPRFDLCSYHLSTSSENFQHVREFYKKAGLGKRPDESREDWLARLKATTKKYLHRMRERMT